MAGSPHSSVRGFIMARSVGDRSTSPARCEIAQMNPRGRAVGLEPTGDIAQTNPSGRPVELQHASDAARTNPRGRSGRLEPTGDLAQTNPRNRPAGLRRAGDGARTNPLPGHRARFTPKSRERTHSGGVAVANGSVVQIQWSLPGEKVGSDSLETTRDAADSDCATTDGFSRVVEILHHSEFAGQAAGADWIDLLDQRKSARRYY